MDTLLSVRGLKTEFSTFHGVVHAVDGVDLTIGKGEVLGLVGESGCGKSVTASSIMYLVPQPPGHIAAGEVWFRGIDLLAGTAGEVAVKRGRGGKIRLVRRDRLLSRHRARMNRIRGREMSMIFQEPMSALNPVLSIGYQLSEVLLFQRRPQICQALLARGALTPEDRELFRRLVATGDPVEHDHRLADFCVRTGLPVERVALVAQASGLAPEDRWARIEKLAARRRRGRGWFLRLLRDTDLAEQRHVEREWRRLSQESLARVIAREFHGARNPLAADLPRLTKVSVRGTGLHLSFATPVSEPGRARLEAWMREARSSPLGPVFELVRGVSLATDGINLGIGEPQDGARPGSTRPLGRVELRLLLAIPRLRRRLMHPVEGECRRQVLELLKLVRIPEPSKVYAEYPHELSGGMQQRVMIAMALACEPALVIADEPTTSLDVTTQAQILDLIRDLRARVHSAILYITHDLAVIAEISDRVAVMYAGKIVEDAPVDELFARPLHPYTQGLLASVVSLDSPKVEVGAPLPTIPGSVPDLIHLPSGCRFHPRCPRAFARCKVEDPRLLDRGGPRRVACHLYDEEAPHDPAP